MTAPYRAALVAEEDRIYAEWVRIDRAIIEYDRTHPKEATP